MQKRMVQIRREKEMRVANPEAEPHPREVLRVHLLLDPREDIIMVLEDIAMAIITPKPTLTMTPPTSTTMLNPGRVPNKAPVIS